LGEATGFVERLGRHIDGKLMRGKVEGGDGHAGAVDGDAVAQANVVQVARGHLESESLAMA